MQANRYVDILCNITYSNVVFRYVNSYLLAFIVCDFNFTVNVTKNNVTVCHSLLYYLLVPGY
jgi:hypothetical protein